MNPGDFLKNLVLDSWYKVLVYLGGIVLVLALFVLVQGASNRQIQAIAGGVCMFGLGVWMDQRKEAWFSTVNIWTGVNSRPMFTTHDRVGVYHGCECGGLSETTWYGFAG